MANIKSQKKRIITNEKSRMRNRAVKSELKTATRRMKDAVAAGNGAEAYAAAFAEMPDLKESFSEDTGKRLALIYLDHISAMVFDREDNAKLLAKF